MTISLTRLCLTLLLTSCLMLAVSCKRDTAEKPRSFEAGIDGIAVAPLPDIDPAMAELSLDNLEDAMPSHRYTGTAEAPQATFDTTEIAETEEETDEEEEMTFESSSEFDFGDSSDFGSSNDANDF